MKITKINNNRGIIERNDERISPLIETNNFLSICFDNSHWDSKNENSSSIVHYNYRLALSKALISSMENEDLAVNFIYLLTSQPANLNIKDFIRGFKSLEAMLIHDFDQKSSKTYSIAVRHYLLTYGGEH